MNPLRLSARNFRSYGEIDLDLPEGSVAVIGANGSGKSSLLMILEMALFGPEGRSLADHLTDDGAATELGIVLVFEHRGETYRVRRAYSARGRGKSALDFERLPERGEENVYPGAGDPVSSDQPRSENRWEPLTREDQKATQDLIERTLGFTRSTFRASSFLAQGDGNSFPEAQPRDRKRLLAEILGLGVWDTVLHAVRVDKRKLEQKLAGDQARVDMLEEQLGQRETLEAARKGHADRVDWAAGHLADSQNEEARLAGIIADHEQARLELIGLKTQLNFAETRVQQLAALEREAEAAQARIAEHEAALIDLPTAAQVAELEVREWKLREAVEAHTARVAEYERAKGEREFAQTQQEAIRAQAAGLNEKADKLREEAGALETRDSGESVCDRCGQTLGAEALASTLASLRVEANDLDAAAEDLEAQANGIEIPDPPMAVNGTPPRLELEDVRLNLGRARSELLEAERGREAIRNLQVAVDRVGTDEFLQEKADADAAAGDIVAKVHTLERDTPPVAELEQADRDLARARGEIAAHRANLEEAQASLHRTEAELDRLTQVAQEAGTLREERAKTSEQLDTLLLLERAAGRDGIPSLIVEQSAIPQLEVEANRILGELGTPFRVQLRTQRALKSGDGLADTLDVVVIADSAERPFETFSGGEQTRISIALRLALAQLLASRRDADSQLLALDEPENLDEAGVAALAGVLRGLTDRFSRVLLVSHVPGLRDAFDTTLTVSRDDAGRSKVAA